MAASFIFGINSKLDSSMRDNQSFPPRLEHKIALIFGGGQIDGETMGNGRATALSFGRHGAKVLIADLNL